MYVLRLCEDKTLLTTKSTPIYQGENETTTIDIFIPKVLNNRNMSNFNIRIEYMLPNGVTSYVQPTLDDDNDYDDYNLYHWLITDDITVLYGRLRFWLVFYTNEDANVMRSSNSYFDILESIQVVNYGSVIEKLVDKINAKADNITLSKDQKIQLTSDNKPIGDDIQINEVQDLDLD